MVRGVATNIKIVILAIEMSEPRKILVVQPSWVGDAVMATPALGRFASNFLRRISRT